MSSYNRRETPGGGTATASIRAGISWNASPATEDTNTLVLTTPTGHFLDLRLPLPSVLSPDQSPASHPSYWVFSGQAFNSGYTISDICTVDPTGPVVGLPGSIVHTRFIHGIDSRAAVGETVVDAGDSVVLPMGEHVEWGVMENPATGRQELYKEVWTAADTGPLRVVRVSGRGIENKDVEGEAVRVGGFVQGVVRREGKVTAGRFVGGEWDGRAGERGVPGEWLMEEGERTVGETVTVGDIVWEVVEVA